MSPFELMAGCHQLVGQCGSGSLPELLRPRRHPRICGLAAPQHVTFGLRAVRRRNLLRSNRPGKFVCNHTLNSRLGGRSSASVATLR